MFYEIIWYYHLFMILSIKIIKKRVIYIFFILPSSLSLLIWVTPTNHSPFSLFHPCKKMGRQTPPPPFDTFNLRINIQRHCQLQEQLQKSRFEFLLIFRNETLNKHPVSSTHHKNKSSNSSGKYTIMNNNDKKKKVKTETTKVSEFLPFRSRRSGKGEGVRGWGGKGVRG